MNKEPIAIHTGHIIKIGEHYLAGYDGEDEEFVFTTNVANAEIVMHTGDLTVREYAEHVRDYKWQLGEEEVKPDAPITIIKCLISIVEEEELK